jgi:hypothetical protein
VLLYRLGRPLIVVPEPTDVRLGSKHEITAPQYCCPLLLSQQT